MTEVPAPIGQWVLDGATVTELCNVNALAAEGQSMHHCVGNYWGDVLSGARIFHLESPGSQPATALYRPHRERGDIRYRLDQIRGPRNSEASAALVHLACRFEAELNSPTRAEEHQLVLDRAHALRDEDAWQLAQPRGALTPRGK